MQVADVQEPLMSVVRVSDAGHLVALTLQVGYIFRLESGQQT